MDIIIAGAGKVGFQLAKKLSINNNVTVIDYNESALQRMQENLDILTICGDVQDPKTYRKVIEQKADLFIAVTDKDEINLLSTLIAGDVLELKKIFIRLRNNFFARGSITQKLGITEVVFPLQLTTSTISHLFEYPIANNIKTFENNDMRLVSIHASYMNESMRKNNSNKCSLVGIERDKKFLFPYEISKIDDADMVYFFGSEGGISNLFSKADPKNLEHNIDKCVIFGAGSLGILISKALAQMGKKVKLVDKDINSCNKAEESLGGEVTVINSKYGTAELFEEERLHYADLFISATDNDEYNIIKCIEAKERGIKRVVAINNELEYYNLMHTLGLTVVRGPKTNAYYSILERIYSSDITTEKKFCGGAMTVFMHKIYSDSRLAGRMVKPYKRLNAIVFIQRDGVLVEFNEKITIIKDDVIVAFAHSQFAEDIHNWISSL